MRLNEDYMSETPVHSFQKLRGTLALERSQIIEEGPFGVGDRIIWYSLPDNKLLVCANPEGVPIKRISSAYIYLETDVTVEEK